MTNKENAEIADRGPQKAATLAVHLVSQVLDDACIILNEATELGKSWRCMSKLKIDNNSRCVIDNEHSTFIVEMGDSDDVDKRHELNTMTTSTPEKVTGQEGDIFQDLSGLRKSTSTFINRLFDMSDVEYIHDDSDLAQKALSTNDSLTEDIFKIVELCVESALVSDIYVQNTILDDGVEKSPSSNQSSYSFLDDAFSSNIDKNIAFYIDDDVTTNSKVDINDYKYNTYENTEASVNVNETIQRNVALYENAYATLNRDDEQYSDEEDFVHQDSKSLALQEVELSVKNTSPVKLPTCDNECKDVATTSAVSASLVSRKSGLVKRCRLQGARLLSCLRGWWWRRKLPGGRKEPRVPGALRGQYTLSPSARIRAASLLDHRRILSPSLSRSNVWKFNTINESVVSSAHLKEYAFQKPECNEY
ncbi:unnamed protein product [Parnassius apollo]|uniref:(apollo) hypothetical protein n=1 Tax=Parnassius apollo TaxID=110799 RepID=A0A8S3WMX7_PARAO|nr:unnamed protein product [Parnassius apollo]